MFLEIGMRFAAFECTDLRLNAVEEATSSEVQLITKDVLLNLYKAGILLPLFSKKENREVPVLYRTSVCS